MAIGRSGFYMSAALHKAKGWIGVFLVIGGPQGKAHYRLLEAHRGAIEAELGVALEWRELPDRKESHVVLRRGDVDLADRPGWPEQHAWLRQTLESFHRASSQRIKALNAESNPVGTVADA